jgi:hypothetical protein
MEDFRDRADLLDGRAPDGGGNRFCRGEAGEVGVGDAAGCLERDQDGREGGIRRSAGSVMLECSGWWCGVGCVFAGFRFGVAVERIG